MKLSEDIEKLCEKCNTIEEERIGTSPYDEAVLDMLIELLKFVSAIAVEVDDIRERIEENDKLR